MSKHNYSQYSNKKKNSSTPKDSEMKPVLNTAPEFKETPMIVQETVETITLPETVKGVVYDCTKLNVRAEPSTIADIVTVLAVDSEVEIITNKSNNEWLYVCTAIGLEGYCMRKFVKANL